MKIKKYQDGRKVTEKEQSKKPFTLQIYQPTEFEKKNPEAARYLKYQQETANYHELERQRKAAAVQKEKEALQKKYGKYKDVNTVGASSTTNILTPVTEQQALRFMQYAPRPEDAYEYTQEYRENTPWLGRALHNAKKILPFVVGQLPDVYEGTGVKRVGQEGGYYTGAYIPIKKTTDAFGNVTSIKTPLGAKLGNIALSLPMWLDMGMGGWKLLSPSTFKAADTAADAFYVSKALNKGIRNTTLPQETAYSQISQGTVNRLFQQNPELAKIGTPELYGEYYNTIYPASKVKVPYAHGTNSNLSGGLANSTKQVNTGAPETIGLNDMYFNRQPEASLQYINGVNTPAGTWNQTRYWPLKEITGKPYNTVGWQEAPITVRQQIPNRAGQFSRVKNADGTFSGHGKLLEEYKAKLGNPDMSDSELLDRLEVKPGESFNDWVARNKGRFEQIYKEGEYPNEGLYFAKVDAKNPLTINGGNTYYGERGVWDKMRTNNNDVLVHNNAANEFNSDVLVVKNVSPEKVNILGSAPDQEGFRRFIGGRYRTTSAPAEYTTIKEHPFYYDKNGKFIPSSNYHYRRGWGINEDAVQTGVIRVPEGDYKPAVLEKYPWLDNGNPFSTTLLNHKFPYFSKGSLWPAKFGQEPADLIAIADNAKDAEWVKGSKFGKLLKDQKPSKILDRSTPLLNGETNKFPTERSTLARYNEGTKRYEIQNNPSTKTYILDAENGPTALPVGEEKEYLLMSPDEQHWHTLLTGRSYGKSIAEPKKQGGILKRK